MAIKSGIFSMFDNSFNSPRNDMAAKSGESLNSDKGGAQTPQYIIVCEDFFDSDIEGFEENASPALWAEVGAARIATYDSSGESTGDGRIVTQDPIVCMKYGSWSPLIQQYMFEGKVVKEIGIKRFISINKTKEIIQELTYSICQIKTYVQAGDTTTFTFCFENMIDSSLSYDHEGKALGRYAVNYNIATMKVTLEK
jgi:hypothetical protein